MSLGASITLAELEADPYPALARLRADEPVSFVPDLDMWLVTRWDDVEFVNAHPELFTSATEPSWLNTVLGRNMLGTDGEEHRRLKDALQPTFSPSSAGSWVNTRLPQLCDELLDAFDPSGTDLMTAYAEPIAVIALQDALGWTNASWPQIGEWTRGVCTGLANFTNEPEPAAIAEHANAESGASIRSGRRAAACRDRAHAGRDRQQRPSLHVGRHQRTARRHRAHDLGPAHPPGGAGHLRRRRDAVAQRLRGAVPMDLASRHRDPPDHGRHRTGGHDDPGRIDGRRRHQLRQPRRASLLAPRRYDIDRREGAHMAFSTGAHVCLGAWLGRTTVRVAVQRFFERFPGAALAADVEISGFEFRGPTSLLVAH